MNNKIFRLLLPALLVGLVATPAFSQDLGKPGHGAASTGMLHVAPPRTKAEKRGERPSPDHRWIGGYWEPQNAKWSWTPGRWEAPGNPGDRWIKPVYHHDKNGYRYEEGRWSH